MVPIARVPVTLKLPAAVRSFVLTVMVPPLVITTSLKSWVTPVPPVIILLPAPLKVVVLAPEINESPLL